MPSEVCGVSREPFFAVISNNTQISKIKTPLLGIYFQISGTAGHGSLLLKNTAGEKLNYIVTKMMSMRAQEQRKLENNPDLTIGDVTTINLTRVGGGVQSNVVPPLLMVCFDVRLAIDVDQVEFENKVK